jgi:hypothetical protein
MGRIIISCDIDPELSDPDHEMGVTDDGYGLIVERLVSIGCDDIDVKKDDDR